jgi:oleandomycin transport system ATP-binding protein
VAQSGGWGDGSGRPRSAARWRSYVWSRPTGSAIAVIDRGRMIDSGTPAELKAKVGGQSLDVRPAEPGQLAKVGAIVAEAAGADAGARSERDGVISAPLAPGVSGTEALAAVSHRLGQAGIDVTELGLRLASLDEVFLILTGGRP